MTDADRRSHDKILRRGEPRRRIEAEIIRRRGIQPNAVVHRLCLRREHLTVCRAEDRHESLCTLFEGNDGIFCRRLRAHDVECEVSADIVCQPRRTADRLHQPAFVPVDLLLRVRPDIVTRRDMLRDRQELFEKHGRRRRQAAGRTAHAAECIGRVVGLARRPRETGERLLCQCRGRYIQRDRHLEEIQRVALHNERVRIAPERRIGPREHLPCGGLDRPAAKRALPAEGSIFRIAVCEEVLCGQDIRTLRFWRLLPIGGKTHKEIIIVGTALRALKEVLEERISTRIVLPECAEIVRHAGLLSIYEGALCPPAAAGKRINLSAQKTLRYLRTPGQNRALADKRMRAAPCRPARGPL